MTEEELAHYGVMGMKWGHTRAQATGSQIRQARARLDGLRTAHTVAVSQKRGTKKGTAERAKAEKTVSRIERDFRKSPDRVIAARMTRGEKAVAILFAGPTMGTSLISIAASSAISRRIEKKQDDGAYNKK